jgi:integrase
MKGSLLKRGPRAYLARISLGRDSTTGRRIYRTRTFHGTKAQAEAGMREMIAQYESTGLVSPDRGSLNAFLEEWLELSKRGEVAASSLASYRKHLRLYVAPTLGTLPLGRISPTDVQALYQRLADQGLAASVIRTVGTLLLQAFRQAVLWRRLAANPAIHARRPRIKKKGATKAMDLAQALAFLAVLRPEDLALELALLSGMRPGEVLGLCWSCVDLVAGVVRVEKARVKLVGQPAQFGPPKTAESYRQISLPRELAAKLRAHRAAQARRRLQAGSAWQDLDLVFPNRKGALGSSSQLNLLFARAQQAAGLSGFCLYSLRHTCATLLLSDGEFVKVITERLGHSGSAITTDTYTHVLPHMQQGAADRFGAMLYGRPRDGGDHQVIKPGV